ncbi:MAG: hypothetical protein WBF08_03995 [Candidatus Bathyarchaeia archaeon]
MASLSSMKFSIYAHHLPNPPAEDRNCDIDLEIVNAKGKMTLRKQDVGLQTRYVLMIPDTGSIGVTSYEQKDVDEAIKDLILACNLSLNITCLSTLKGDLDKPEIQTKAKEFPNEIESDSEELHVRIHETIVIRESVHITIKENEELDENQVIENFRLLRKLSRHTISVDGPISIISLSKALSEFEIAMTVFSRLMVFKHLFNSLELSINWDGIPREGDALDREVVKVSGIEKETIVNWRRLYNRTKHVDRTAEDSMEFIKGLENMGQMLIPLRKVTSSLILNRIQKLR